MIGQSVAFAQTNPVENEKRYVVHVVYPGALARTTKSSGGRGMLKNPDASVDDWSKYPLPKIGSTVKRTPGRPAPVTPSRTYPRTPNESGVSPMFRRTVPSHDTDTDVAVRAPPSAVSRSSAWPAGAWV